MSGEDQPSIGDAVYKFVGHKISKVRWCPSESHLTPTTEFVTGSWDDEVNHVSLWTIPNLLEHDSQDIDDDLTNEPELLDKIRLNGSVMDIKFLDKNLFITGSTSGDVILYQLQNGKQVLKQKACWSSVHHFDYGEIAPCTGISVKHGDIVTVGEDGSINLIQAEASKPLLVLGNVDGTITGVAHVSSFEVATINSIGQLKLWDLRTKSKSPARVLCLSGEKSPLSAIDGHPNQGHILTTGSINGNVGFWDLRQENFPVTLVEAHSSSVWEVQFHHLYPENLFTCSEDGSLWYWNGSSMGAKSMDYRTPMGRSKTSNSTSGHHDLRSIASSSVWLSFDVNKHKVETYSLLSSNKRPVNSFDIESHTLICGTDSEALILVKNVPIR